MCPPPRHASGSDAQPRNDTCRNAESDSVPLLPLCAHLARHLRITEAALAHIEDLNPYAILHFLRTKVAKMLLPTLELKQRIGDGFRDQNVPCVSQVHHPLGNVDAASGHIQVLIDIGYAIHQAAVYPHSQTDSRVFLKYCGKFE